MPDTDFSSSPGVVLITGISGSGKSVALHALEDAGYYCVDNLPPEMVPDLLSRVQRDRRDKVAIAVDVRSLASPSGIVQGSAIEALTKGAKVLFLDASTPSLVQRFSETRRMHPLSATEGTLGSDLMHAIELERELLAPLKERAQSFDTSHTTPAQLRAWIKQMVQAPAGALMLVFESFGFKRGLPMEADFVFDARMLPNPFYDNMLRPLTGRDPAVQTYFTQYPQVAHFTRDIGDMVERWLPHFIADHRSYLTVAVGCTGGQHRSVYIAEQLSARFAKTHQSVLRHRDIKPSTGFMDSQFELSLDIIAPKATQGALKV